MIQQGFLLIDAADRLRAFIRETQPGGCRMLSVGPYCICPLCDVERLYYAAAGKQAVAKDSAS